MKLTKLGFNLKLILGRGLILGSLSYCLAMVVIAIDGLSERYQPADVAIVLGNQVNLDGTPSPRLKSRLDRTVRLYQQGQVKRILVTGGVGKEGFDEAAVMADFLQSQGIPTGAIIQDPKGNNTWASAINAKNLLTCPNGCRVIAVSQFFHLPRTRTALIKVGFREVGTARADYFEFRDIYSLFREVPANIKYLIF